MTPVPSVFPIDPVFPIDGVARRYEWGSPTAIPQLLGVPPDGRPLAELWFGAHPGDPSPALGSTLETLITSFPDALLGTGVVAEYGARLPFLVKLLSAGRALSVQVHPSREEAEAGFAREQAAGIPVDAPHRTYRDRNAKPELVCALTPFDALCGFRPVERTIGLLEELGVGQLRPLIDLLRGVDPLRRAVTAVLTGSDPGAAAAVTERLADVTEGPLRGAALAAADFPGDRGVVLSLLLNYVVLEPTEALFLDAGTVHAYLRGTAVEVMGNSDNVVRCGLTPKYVDGEQLLAITRFAETPDPRLRPEPVGSDALCYPAPAREFAACKVSLTGRSRPCDADGPAVVLCTSGRPSVTVDDCTVALTPGRAAFVRARPSALHLRGDGEVFLVHSGSAGS